MRAPRILFIILIIYSVGLTYVTLSNYQLWKKEKASQFVLPQGVSNKKFNEGNTLYDIEDMELRSVIEQQMKVRNTPSHLINLRTVSPPTEAPTILLTNSPTNPPTKVPIKPPNKPPVKAPTKSPTKAPTKAPTLPPTLPPTNPPTNPPTTPPTFPPTKVPTTPPSKSVTKSAPKKTIRLILGTVKSGIVNLHQEFKSKSIDFGYNLFRNSGAISWKFATRDESRFLLEKIPVHPWPVVHIVRHPLSVVKLFESEKLTFKDQILRGVVRPGIEFEKEEQEVWRYMKEHIDIPEEQDISVQALHYWVGWNKLIQKNFPNAVIFQIEDIQPNYFYNTLTLISKHKINPLTPHRAFFPPYQLGIKGKSWEELESLGGKEIVDEAKALTLQYKYQFNEPITIKIYHFMCGDQVHFLVNFLSTLPYSRERPLRFLYDARTDLQEISKSIPEFSIFFTLTTYKRWKSLVELGERSKNYGIVVHKDEYCEFDVNEFPSAAIKYRGYYDENLLSETVKFFPLGVRKVFPITHPGEVVPVLKRQYDCNLIVSLDTSPSRKLLADIVRNSTEFNCFVHTIEAWSGSFQGYIGPEEYKAKLLQSSFTLSPRGHNIECYRMYEACETGSIPIIEDVEEEELQKGSEKPKVCKGSLEPFKQSNAPFIYISDWTTLPDLLRSLLSDKKGLERRQKELLDWYYNFKLTAITDFENNLARVWSPE